MKLMYFCRHLANPTLPLLCLGRMRKPPLVEKLKLRYVVISFEIYLKIVSIILPNSPITLFVIFQPIRELKQSRFSDLFLSSKTANECQICKQLPFLRETLTYIYIFLLCFLSTNLFCR